MSKYNPKQRPNPENDAKGQFAKSKADGSNDGVSSADPKVITGKKGGDATFPLKQDKGKWAHSLLYVSSTLSSRLRCLSVLGTFGNGWTRT